MVSKREQTSDRKFKQTKRNQCVSKELTNSFQFWLFWWERDFSSRVWHEINIQEEESVLKYVDVCFKIIATNINKWISTDKRLSNLERPANFPTWINQTEISTIYEYKDPQNQLSRCFLMTSKLLSQFSVRKF